MNECSNKNWKINIKTWSLKKISALKFTKLYFNCKIITIMIESIDIESWKLKENERSDNFVNKNVKGGRGYL